jgi:ATPase family AAA domain-containing protein 1
MVIASTNRPFDLDEAVLRRLPRRILVDLPDLHTRREILSVTLSGNRLDASVNLTALAEKLEGYTGSDIKEVCREAVVRVAHERAQMLERGVEAIDGAGAGTGRGRGKGKGKGSGTESASESTDQVLDFNAPLRPTSLDDFRYAMRKLKASVNDNGRELQKVVEWNAKYGEIRRKPSQLSASKRLGSSGHMSMYV